MKIAKVLQQNRSKGGKNIQDIYIRFSETYFNINTKDAKLLYIDVL